jgi:hypothetical protein
MVTYYMIMPQTAPRWNRILLLLLQNQRPMQHLPPKHKSEECWQLFHSDGFSLVVIKISKMSQNMELCSPKTGTEIVTWANLASEVVELRGGLTELWGTGGGLAAPFRCFTGCHTSMHMDPRWKPPPKWQRELDRDSTQLFLPRASSCPHVGRIRS